MADGSLDDSDIRRLRLFLAAVDGTSMRAGAQALNLKRSSIRSAINILETRLGVSLVNRDQSGIDLTPIGSQVADHARGLLESCDVYLNDIAAVCATAKTELKVGSAYGFHSVLVEAARSCLPGHVLKAEVMEIVDPAREIIEGHVDLGLLMGPTAKDDLLDRFPISQEPRVALLRDGQLPSFEGSSIDLAVLDDFMWPELPQHGDMTYLGPWVCADLRGSFPPKRSYVRPDVISLRAWLIGGGTVIATTQTIANMFSFEGLLTAVPIHAPPWNLDLVVRKGSGLPAAEIAAALLALVS